jgi:hypothetical protein
MNKMKLGVMFVAMMSVASVVCADPIVSWDVSDISNTYYADADTMADGIYGGWLWMVKPDHYGFGFQLTNDFEYTIENIIVDYADGTTYTIDVKDREMKQWRWVKYNIKGFDPIKNPTRVTVNGIPEPATIAMVVIIGIGIWFKRRLMM